MQEKGVEQLESELNKKTKLVVMLAPSFVAEWSYPEVLLKLRKLGFDKAVELTFGAKMINRIYHKKLKNLKKGEIVISSVCAGIQQTILGKYPKLKKNLIKIDSPMIAMGKVCKKFYPDYKIVFIAPCEFKKIEAKNSENIDFVINYQELNKLFDKYKIKINKLECKGHSCLFDKFYNDYTKIYPLAGGLSKTIHLKGILKKDEIEIIDGILKVEKFLENPKKGIKFLDVNFCEGGCVGGPALRKDLTLKQKKQRVLDYIKVSNVECIPENRKGLIEKAKGLKFG
ncbi:MAG: [Fe-Fe] hydrogenase large subunit C-terminal domain-containing protein [Nanoarchaeota archaeon]|nr:[Fe-Fe] hydrogenase large subunit C-terminal domain-containing protein [Nanoarchaeota archaeon]